MVGVGAGRRLLDDVPLERQRLLPVPDVLAAHHENQARAQSTPSCATEIYLHIWCAHARPMKGSLQYVHLSHIIYTWSRIKRHTYRTLQPAIIICGKQAAARVQATVCRCIPAKASRILPPERLRLDRPRCKSGGVGGCAGVGRCKYACRTLL